MTIENQHFKRKWELSNPVGLNVLLLVCDFIYLGDNCIQNVHLGRYIVGYMIGNLVLRRRASGTVKHDF